LTVAEIIAEIRVLRPRSFAAVTARQASIAAERPHQNAANWYYRPHAAGDESLTECGPGAVTSRSPALE